MNDRRGFMLVDRDTVVRGQIRNCRRIEIYGYVDGELAAETVIVHDGGQLYGKIRSETAEVSGKIQGELRVKNLIKINSSGSVHGDVQYGQLALEAGGDLSAQMRNIPPSLAGDFNLVVRRGQAVAVTTEDLTALDPDDAASDLVYAVSNLANGYLALSHTPGVPVERFTQADILSGAVLFQHDGLSAAEARFDVMVTDRAGASSGAPRTVTVSVNDR